MYVHVDNFRITLLKTPLNIVLILDKSLPKTIISYLLLSMPDTYF